MKPLYDWPLVLRPRSAIVIAPNNTIDGRISRNGFEDNNPVPGSRNQVRMEFPPHQGDIGSLYSWMINVGKSSLFRVPVWKCPQLATSAAIEAKENEFLKGIPFSTGEGFSTGYGFKYNPTIDLYENVLEGDTTVKLDMTRHPNILSTGHVFGLGRSTHHVDDISYDGDIATIECRTPFRRDYSTTGIDKIVTLRPSVICQIRDINSFISLFQPARLFVPGPLVLNEVIDERFL